MKEMVTIQEMNHYTTEQIAELLDKVPEPPWFVDSDEAKECGPHSYSGLALVDTGRTSEWPIARLCEWPTANFIAAAPEIVRQLLAENAELRQIIAGLSGFA
jgi:hypothetical protein